MSGETVQLRLAQYEDFEDFLRLKSEANNIYWSGFDDKPNRDNLMCHFVAAIESQTRTFYLLFEQDQAIGYLYVDYDSELPVVEIAYGISAHQSGRGLAKLMIEKGLLEVRTGFTTIVAWIAVSNVPSIKSAEALGFQASQEQEHRTFAQESKPVKFCKYVKYSGGEDES